MSLISRMRAGSLGVLLVLLLLSSKSALAVPFEVTYHFPGGFHIRYSEIGIDYFFTPLALDSSLEGASVTIHSISVSSFGHNGAEVINFDWEVYLGPEPFGLPQGQFIRAQVDPNIGYVRSAPTQLRFVIGAKFDIQDYLFAGDFDFLSHAISATPYLSRLKGAFTSPMDLPDGLYAQLYLWTLDSRGCYITFDELTLVVRGEIVPSAVAIALDIKPGSDLNSVNLRSGGLLPVAVLSTAEFDATQVDSQSVTFGPGGAKEAHGVGHIEDVNDDGWLDLLLHFEVQATGLRCGDTEARLTGETSGGEAIEGTDAVRIEGCR